MGLLQIELLRTGAIRYVTGIEQNGDVSYSIYDIRALPATQENINLVQSYINKVNAPVEIYSN